MNNCGFHGILQWILGINAMRYVKLMVLVMLVVSIGIFGMAQVQEWMDRDVSKPEITSDVNMIEATCAYTEEELLVGLYAEDKQDGDLTDKILVGEVSRFINRGVCNVTYVVFDEANNSGTLVRKLKLTDYEPPKFILKAPLVFTEAEGNSQKMGYRIGAIDMMDGDLTEWIQTVEDTIDYQLAGEYHVTLDVSNSYGDTVSVELPVHILKPGMNDIRIELSQYLVYSKVGESVNPQSYIKSVSDLSGNDLGTGIVQYESEMDINTPGSYEIHYTAKDASGNTGETWLTVIVWE